jgi:DNA-nicking Smr family endonuclease
MANDGKPPREDDMALWRRIADQVKPLKDRAKPPPQANHADPKPAPKPGAKPVAGAARSATPAPPRPKPPPPALKPGVTPGVDRRTADRLRRGQLPIEAEIDLHGLTQADAHRALVAFISGQHAAGRRCVRVITGKGTFREGGGVLRAAVPRWLNEADMRAAVLAISHAQPRDGGGGALYVLLKRRR